MTMAMARMGLLPLLLAGCLASQASGGSAARSRDTETATSITASEKAQGAKAHSEILAEFGGLYDGPQAAYVTQVGRRIAVQSSLSKQQGDFTISLLDSSVNNAFALPGGYVYVTRQLVALMNDEAELAGVLGHEVGHVAAQHSKKRQGAATRNSILGVLGAVLVGQVAGDSAVGGLLQRSIGTGVQLFTLKYSRTQEYQADDLGVRYLAKAGYDPSALSSMLASLAAQTALDGDVNGHSGSVPEWASTHPDPAARVQRALAAARASGVTSRYRNKAVFLSQLEGLLYGEDPAQGIVSKGEFAHPALKFKFAVPAGFSVDNQADAVTLSGQSARAQFSAGPLDGTLDAYVQGVFDQLAGQGNQAPAIAVQRTSINGIPAAHGHASMTNSQGSRLDITVIAYEFTPKRAFHFIVATPAGQGLGALDRTVRSFARLSDAEAAAVKPRKVHLVTIRAGDTPASLARRMAYDDHQLERFLVLNGLKSGASLTPGMTVKLVTY